VMSKASVAVFGAYGHTGHFIVSELRKRGWRPILSGRDAERLKALSNATGGLEVRAASVEDPASLDQALHGAAAVINCAGPFIDTITPIIEAALRARIPCLDMAAEQQAALIPFERFADAARNAGIAIIPAMAFYGGLADLMVTAAMGDWTAVDDVRIAIALDSWHPTQGTRITGRRNTARRLVISKYGLDHLPDPPPTREWEFPAPFGTQQVVSLPLSEMITLFQHVKAREIHSYMNLAPLKDLRDPNTPPPKPADDSGRSSQVFVMDVVLANGNEARRATVQGRDIYAISATLVVEAMERILSSAHKPVGVLAPGEAFDARDFLQALTPEHLSLMLP
jgi:short subunit dehydrogenase-like uncharacterized protein